MLTLLLTAPLYLAARLLGGRVVVGSRTPDPEPRVIAPPMALMRCTTCRGGDLYRTRRPPCPTCGGCGEVWRPV